MKNACLRSRGASRNNSLVALAFLMCPLNAVCSFEVMRYYKSQTTFPVLEYSGWSVIIWGENNYSVTGDVSVKPSSSDLLNLDVQIFELQPFEKGFQLVSTTNPEARVKVDFLVSR
jgi:hypothetical protein